MRFKFRNVWKRANVARRPRRGLGLSPRALMGSLKSGVQGEDGDGGGVWRVTAQGAVARALVNRRRAPHYV